MVLNKMCRDFKIHCFSGGERDKAKQVLNKLVNEEEAKLMFESLIKEAALSQVSGF
jgi:hypothetical protein